MDIDDLRDPEIKLHGLVKADAVYNFYHDETNNVRKLGLNSGGFNVSELSVFVLGGVVQVGGSTSLEIGSLREVMRIQKTAPELKLELIGKGDFLAVLRSQKLTCFLRWLLDSSLLIHFNELDPFYWSIVDIIDAILPNLDHPYLVAYHGQLKADLTEVLRADIAHTAEIFFRYGYPGIKPDQHVDFLNELLALVEHSEGILAHFSHHMLKGVLQAGRTLVPLDFSIGTTPRLLIDNFSSFYLHRLAIFKNSHHVFDMEPVIQSHLLQTPLTSCGVPVTHFRFSDSRSEPGLQLSDIVVGLLGKMHTYLTRTSHGEVAMAREALNGVGLENALLLRDLISASDAENVAFLHHMASSYDIEKLDLLLHLSEEP